MQMVMLLMGIAVASQITDSGDNRYPPEGSGTIVEPPRQEQFESDPQDGFVAPPTTPPDYRHSDSPPTNLLVPPRDPATSYPQDQLGAATPNESSPPRNVDGVAPLSKPSQLLQTLLTPVSRSLAGVPLTLAQALEGTASRDEQTRRVELYWELAIAMAEHYSAQRAQTELQTLRQGIAQPAESWNRWQTEFANNARFAQARAKSLQLRLANELGRAGDVDLPLPSDRPHCGKYDSRFDQIFSDRQSPEARQLHELLPMQYQGLRQEAESVALAYQRLEIVSSRRNPQSGGEELLQAYGLIATRRPHFLRLVCDYNTSIARYTELALPGQMETGRLVATLIQVEPGARATWQRSGIRRTSAEEPAGDAPPRGERTQTFEGGTSGGTTGPPAASRGTRERSIVVRRQ